MSSAIASKDKLVIGIAQFPSTLHPNIDTVAAKSYIHAMTARHFTVFDKDWKLICMLFIKLPTIENGLAKNKKHPMEKRTFCYLFHSLRSELG
jgi:peptide/nickel transport system substrate-binding protein